MVLVVAGTGPSVANAFPAGFTDSFVASVSSPTTVEPLPGGRIAVLSKGGQLRVIDTKTSASTLALSLSVCSTSERGLLGFTADPDVARTGRVYVYYTAITGGGGCVNRVSAFTMSGNTIAPSSEQILIDNIPSTGGNHNGGDLDVGNDGALYVSVGDAGRDPRGDSGSGGSNNAAQDLTLLNGKILRLDRLTGLPAVGNPLGGPGATNCGSRGTTPAGTICREIYASGLRNPYRFAFDPNTSATRFFINDVGQSTQEEVDLGAAGANYGWNAREGNCPTGQVSPCAGPPAGVTDPLTSYGRSLGTYITAGAFVPNGVWPAAYDDSYLFADGGTGRIWLREADGTVNYASPFATVSAGISDMAFVMEESGYALYYSLSGSSAVRKITYAAPVSTPPGPTVYSPLVTPERVYDSRTLTPAAPVRGGTAQLINVGPIGGLPTGARAALVNITVDRPAGGWFATVWEPRTRRPTTSNVNALDGAIAANTSIVPIDDLGRMLLYSHSTADVIIDVSGYFVDAPSATSAGRFEALDPLRLVDTRVASSSTNEYDVTFRRGDPVSGGTATTDRLSVPVAGRLGVPDSGVSAVALVVTGLSEGSAPAGWVQITPGNRPNQTSNLNTDAGFDQRNNLVVVPLGADGTVDVNLFHTDRVLLDVVGWFTDSTEPASTSGRFQLVASKREVDTRINLGFGPLAKTGSESLNPTSVPNGAAAVAQNLTVAPATTLSFVSVYPGTVRPEVSNLNSTEYGQIRAAAAFTKLDSGAETVYSHYETDLVIDVFGYFS
jgi:glucose/arabinose dehydrogenase